MKRFLFVVATLFCTAAHASNEGQCLQAGKVGEFFASSAKMASEQELKGMVSEHIKSEKAAAKTKEDRQFAEKIERRDNAILSYVFTMQLEPAQARKMVYLKCIAGDFE